MKRAHNFILSSGFACRFIGRTLDTLFRVIYSRVTVPRGAVKLQNAARSVHPRAKGSVAPRLDPGRCRFRCRLKSTDRAPSLDSASPLLLLQLARTRCVVHAEALRSSRRLLLRRAALIDRLIDLLIERCTCSLPTRSLGDDSW